MWFISLCSLPRGFPAPRGQSSHPASFADCHWKQAIFHPQGGWTQECSDTANLGSVPSPHDPVPGNPSLCQSVSPGSLCLLLYPCLQSPWAEMNMISGRGLLHMVCSRLPLQLCFVNKSPVTYTPAWVTHLPEKVLCSPKQICLENDEGTYQMQSMGPTNYCTRSRHTLPLTSSLKSSVELPLQACWFHFHLNMMLDIR